MPASSPKQRRFMAMVLATKRGDMTSPSPKVKKAASSISESAAADFARKTPRRSMAKGLMKK